MCTAYSSSLYWISYWILHTHHKWKWHCVYGCPRLSCDFQLQRWCGLAIVVLEGRPEQQQAGLESFFPLEANRMSLMNHSVFELSHLTILGTQPSSLACTTRKREKHSEMRNMQEKKTEHVSNTGNAASETKTTNQMLVITAGNVWVIYHRGFKSPRPSCSCCAGASVSPPHRTHLHVTFDAASRSHHSQQFSEVCSSLLIYFWGFKKKKKKKSKHRCLPQATDRWEWPAWLVVASVLSVPAVSTRWCCWRIV